MTTPDPETCEHYLVVDSITEPVESERRTGVRTIHAVCRDCGFTQDILTTKTDEEIVAELEAQGRTLQGEEVPE